MKRITTSIATCLVAGGLIGCASFQLPSPEFLAKQSVGRLCYLRQNPPVPLESILNINVVSYESKYRVAVMDELRRRQAFTESELDLIGSWEVGVGMTEHALHCMWGEPDEVNRSVYNQYVRKQNIYEQPIRKYDTTYVYTENGIVTSWSD